jgi:hypothetical protein
VAIQIVAVRMDVGADVVGNIVEVVWRQDETGKCGGLTREAFAKWMINFPAQVVYTRDYVGNVARVVAFEFQGLCYIRSVTPGGPRDPLLALPRYLTPTR